MDSYNLIYIYEPNRIFNMLPNYYNDWNSEILLNSKKYIIKYKNLRHIQNNDLFYSKMY